MVQMTRSMERSWLDVAGFLLLESEGILSSLARSWIMMHESHKASQGITETVEADSKIPWALTRRTGPHVLHGGDALTNHWKRNTVCGTVVSRVDWCREDWSVPIPVVKMLHSVDDASSCRTVKSTQIRAIFCWWDWCVQCVIVLMRKRSEGQENNHQHFVKFNWSCLFLEYSISKLSVNSNVGTYIPSLLVCM